ncbi:MAG: hypothetical protein ACK52S_14260, partial [Pirellula sp.]
MRALLLLIVGIVSVSHGSAMAAIVVLDGGFESQALSQNLPYYRTGLSGQLWGKDWGAAGDESSWR